MMQCSHVVSDDSFPPFRIVLRLHSIPLHPPTSASSHLDYSTAISSTLASSSVHTRPGSKFEKCCCWCFTLPIEPCCGGMRSISVTSSRLCLRHGVWRRCAHDDSDKAKFPNPPQTSALPTWKPFVELLFIDGNILSWKRLEEWMTDGMRLM